MALRPTTGPRPCEGEKEQGSNRRPEKFSFLIFGEQTARDLLSRSAVFPYQKTKRSLRQKKSGSHKNKSEFKLLINNCALRRSQRRQPPGMKPEKAEADQCNQPERDQQSLCHSFPESSLNETDYFTSCRNAW